MKKLIPADTADANGNVWETTGENIRRGAKEFSEDSVKEIVAILFPVGSVYCGENRFITSVGSWEAVTNGAPSVIRLGVSSMTGELMKLGAISESETEKAQFPALRMWRRIE